MKKEIILFFCLTLVCCKPAWTMEHNKETVQAIVQSLDKARAICFQSMIQAESDDCKEPYITSAIAQLKDEVRRLRTHVVAINKIVPNAAPSLALTEEYARLHVLAERAQERLGAANIVLNASPSWLHNHAYHPQAFITELRDFNFELYTAQQFVSCFFSALAAIDENIAQTKKRICPIQELADGLIHMGKTIEQAGDTELGLAPLIRATTCLGLAALQQKRKSQISLDPALEFDLHHRAESSSAARNVTLRDTLKVGRKLIDHVDSAKNVSNVVADFCKSRGPKALAVLDQLLDKLVHAPAEQHTPEEELTTEEFISRHLGDDFMQKRVTDVFDFLIEPYCGPTLLRVAQRLPSFVLSPFMATQDRDEIMGALQNAGIQPSDISLLSDKIKQQFKITPEHQERAKKTTREILATITRLLKPENAGKIISITQTVTSTAEKIVATLNDCATTQALGTIALDGLETIAQHHTEVTHEEQEIITQFKELGFYAQRTLEESLQAPCKNYEAQEE